jgi:hypothetical protein
MNHGAVGQFMDPPRRARGDGTVDDCQRRPIFSDIIDARANKIIDIKRKTDMQNVTQAISIDRVNVHTNCFIFFLDQFEQRPANLTKSYDDDFSAHYSSLVVFNTSPYDYGVGPIGFLKR